MANHRTSIRTELDDAHRRLAAILATYDHTIDELLDSQPGYPTSTVGGGGTPRLSADGTPSGLDRYLIGPNPAAEDLRNLRRAAIAAHNATREIQTILARWNTTAVTGDDRPRSGGTCHACNRYCTGGADRLRSGLCDACRHSWTRYQERARRDAGAGDRGDWLLERRRILATEVRS